MRRCRHEPARMPADFLPTIEKFGKTCQVLLGADEVHFIQTSLNTDGVHVTARFAAVSGGVHQCNTAQPAGIPNIPANTSTDMRDLETALA